MWITWSVLYYCRTYVDNMVRFILLQNGCGQHGLYYIIVERMWTTWSVSHCCRTHVDNMVRIILLLNVFGLLLSVFVLPKQL